MSVQIPHGTALAPYNTNHAPTHWNTRSIRTTIPNWQVGFHQPNYEGPQAPITIHGITLIRYDIVDEVDWSRTLYQVPIWHGQTWNQHQPVWESSNWDNNRYQFPSQWNGMNDHAQNTWNAPQHGQSPAAYSAQSQFQFDRQFEPQFNGNQAKTPRWTRNASSVFIAPTKVQKYQTEQND